MLRRERREQYGEQEARAAGCFDRSSPDRCGGLNVNIRRHQGSARHLPREFSRIEGWWHHGRVRLLDQTRKNYSPWARFYTGDVKFRRRLRGEAAVATHAESEAPTHSSYITPTGAMLACNFPTRPAHPSNLCFALSSPSPLLCQIHDRPS